uniref:Uncharacterized protein n=1 Tax=Tetranychus urticae TaxID=32264 RepID=T1KAH0_TETUR
MFLSLTIILLIGSVHLSICFPFNNFKPFRPIHDFGFNDLPTNDPELDSFADLAKQFNSTLESVINSTNGQLDPLVDPLYYQDLTKFNATLNQQLQQQEGNEFLRDAVLAVMFQQLKGFFPGLDLNRFELFAKVFANFWPTIRDFMRDNPKFFENIYNRLVRGNSSSDASMVNFTTFSPQILLD